MCGIAGVSLPRDKTDSLNNSMSHLCKMLLQEQNRGQLSAGITTYSSERPAILKTYKKLGTVIDVFKLHHKGKFNSLLNKLDGSAGIGHVRYATSGVDDDVNYAQPLERPHGRLWKWFALSFNGNLANYDELKLQLEDIDYHLEMNLDTEVIKHLISRELRGERKDYVNLFSELSEMFDGCYNTAFVNAEGTAIALRDPLGFRPLNYVNIDDFTGFASESISLQNYSQDGNGIKSVQPGEMLIMNDGNLEVKRFAKCKEKKHCMFEWVYFANASSVIDDRLVYQARWDLGRELGKSEDLNIDDDTIVVGVPDTAKPAADAMASELGVDAKEGLMRNRYVGRTFIQSKERLERVKEKFSLNKGVLKDKKVILVEDSVVRGNTGKALIQYIKEFGKAKEVHVRVSCPPVRFPCFYGIDMSTVSELLASKHVDLDKRGMFDLDERQNEGIAKELNADSVKYQSFRGLIKGIGLENKEKDLCMACITGEYPTPCGKKLVGKAIENAKKGVKGRTYQCGC